MRDVEALRVPSGIKPQHALNHGATFSHLGPFLLLIAKKGEPLVLCISVGLPQTLTTGSADQDVWELKYRTSEGLEVPHSIFMWYVCRPFISHYGLDWEVNLRTANFNNSQCGVVERVTG